MAQAPFSMLYFLNSPVLDFWEFEINKLLCCSTALAWQVRDQYHFGFLLIHFSMNYYKTLWVSHIVSALTSQFCKKNIWYKLNFFLIRLKILKNKWLLIAFFLSLFSWHYLWWNKFAAFLKFRGCCLDSIQYKYTYWPKWAPPYKLFVKCDRIAFFISLWLQSHSPYFF